MQNALRVGLFLAYRQIKRTSVWTTVLIIFVMTLTFLNLVVVGGILVGLTAGARKAYSDEYSGDVLIRSLMMKDYIDQSQILLRTLAVTPEVKAFTPRYVVAAKAESNYKTQIGPGKSPDSVTAIVAGVDPVTESQVTDNATRLLEGSYLEPDQEGYVVLGKNLVDKYTITAGSISQLVLRGVDVGSKIRLTINGNTKEYIVKGIISGKIQEVSTRIFMNGVELRRLMNRDDQNVDEIAIRLVSGASPARVVNDLKQQGFDKLARVETSLESQGTFLDDIAKTFGLLSDVIGAIGLLVASITVFIVIFINAVTRRKFIGIMKGIGVSGAAIEVSYVLQSLFYGIIGSAIGLSIIYGFLKPYFDKNPINFPFADGLLLVPIEETLIRAGVLLLITVLAGYIPARMIVSRNTLDAILGR